MMIRFTLRTLKWLHEVTRTRTRGTLTVLSLCLVLVFNFIMGWNFSPLASAAKGDRSTPGEYRVLEIDGVINPLSARYLLREIKEADQDRAAALILKLNTPGGLESSMREMTEGILNSPVPVISFVSPVGARAASAGMFIVISSHIAAMTPDTTIGAAHPVRLGSSGAQTQGEDAQHMADKMVNDAASFARALAQRWGRNAVWAEEAVRTSVSITAEEALKQNVIDVVAEDPQRLLKALHGREVRVLEDRVVRISAPESPDALAERPMTFFLPVPGLPPPRQLNEEARSPERAPIVASK
jgi:membrane-bound serine protease (ClpP class)